jgi:uncharacterized membrane protein YbhN (UPF0104 family)
VTPDPPEPESTSSTAPTAPTVPTGWSGAVARVVALRERILSSERRSPATERVVLAGAVVLFVGATVLAARDLPNVHAHRNLALLIVLALVGVPASVLVNAAEYVAAGRSLGHRLGTLHAARVSTVATAANLLPIPGAVVVRARALRVLGTQYRRSLAVLGSIGVIWLGTTGVLSGVVLLIDGEHVGLGLAFIGGGLLSGAAAYALLRVPLSDTEARHWFGRFVVIEIVSVAVYAMRFVLVLRGLGFHSSWSETFTLTIATSAASAVGVLPGGLGLREVLAAALAPLVGLPAAVALFAVSVDRIIGLVVLALMTGILLLFGRRDRAMSEP